MVRFALSSLITIMFLPSALAASQLLRRTSTLKKHYDQAKDSVLPYIPSPSDALDTLQALLVDEEEQQLLSQLLSQGFSMFSMSMPISLPTCKSAYAYCGQGISTCSLDGGWELDFSAMDLDSGFHLQCELRIGSGRCIEGADYEISPDAPIGTFEITEEFLHTAVFPSLDVGMVDDISLVVSDALGGPVRRHLSSFEGHTEEIVEHLSSLEGEGEELVGIAKHLYHDLEFMFEDYNIVLGGELSQEHVAFYATICPCAGDICEWSNIPDNNGGVSPGVTLDPSATSEPSAVPSASPSLSPSSSVEPTVSPSQSPTSSQSPTTAPNTVPNGQIPNIKGDGNNVEKSPADSSPLSAISIVGIVAGCVAALVVAAMLIARSKKANNSGSSVPSGLEDDSSM